MSSITPTEWGMLILLSIFWGGSFFFTEIALCDFKPFTVVFLRVTLAALILFTVLLAHLLTSDERLTLRILFGVLIGFLGMTPKAYKQHGKGQKIHYSVIKCPPCFASIGSN